MPIPVTDDQERAGVLEVDQQLVEDIAALLRSGQRGMVLNLVTDLGGADLARLLEHLPFEEARTLFAWLPAEQGGEVLTELDSAYRTQLLQETEAGRVTELLDPLNTDDAVDILADLPPEMAQEVLPQLEDAPDLQDLLLYGEETAGGLMGTEYVAVPRTWTVEEATEEVRRHAETVEQLYAIYVIDDEDVLQGLVSIKRLLLSPADAKIGEIMDTDVIAVRTDVDQEEAARVIERYDLASLPVIDARGRLVGRITHDDALDVIREEAEEDIQRMSGVSGDEEPTDSVWRISRGRLPWLLIGLLGAGLAGVVIGQFEGALEAVPILATFIPIVMAMAGNAGIQSSAIIVQGLASGDVWSSDLLRRLGKETAVAVINGLVLAFVLGGAIVLLGQAGWGGPDMARLAVTAALALLIVILLATLIGTTIPLLLHRLDIDPALATGPFITASNDIIGLTVFFVLATLIYGAGA